MPAIVSIETGGTLALRFQDRYPVRILLHVGLSSPVMGLFPYFADLFQGELVVRVEACSSVLARIRGTLVEVNIAVESNKARSAAAVVKIQPISTLSIV